jgi:hypothetical protein
VTPEEFAALHGLTVEEAQLILTRRSLPKPSPGGRLAQAMKALTEAVRKTGVAPVRIEGGVLEKSELLDPEALERFYASKGGSNLPRPKRAIRPPALAEEDVSQDPEDH